MWLVAASAETGHCPITGGTSGECLVITEEEKREARRRERRREEKRGTLLLHEAHCSSCTAWHVLIQAWKSIFAYLRILMEEGNPLLKSVPENF